MAYDWIKMRSQLWTHPRFIALVNQLIYGDGGKENVGFLKYVCGDALGLDVYPPDNENVTTRALRIVTKNALRDVTMCSLLRVWSAINAHCEVEGNDAICTPMCASDLDEIAGFYGFGYALESVGWVEERNEDYSLVFKNFVKYNEPFCLRKKPAKTNAQRQKEYREKKKIEKAVTKRNESNAREEKRREEIYSSSKNITRQKFSPPLSESLLADWLEVRKNRKIGKVTKTVWDGIEREASKAGITAEDAVKVCCERGWGSFKAEWIQETKKPEQTRHEQPWWSSPQKIMAKGTELGLSARPGESMADYKGRIENKIAEGV